MQSAQIKSVENAASGISFQRPKLSSDRSPFALSLSRSVTLPLLAHSLCRQRQCKCIQIPVHSNAIYRCKFLIGYYFMAMTFGSEPSYRLSIVLCITHLLLLLLLLPFAAPLFQPTVALPSADAAASLSASASASVAVAVIVHVCILNYFLCMRYGVCIGIRGCAVFLFFSFCLLLLLPAFYVTSSHKLEEFCYISCVSLVLLTFLQL